MRRNSLSKIDSKEITPHTHSATALKPPSPAEAREMAKNLKSRKIKLITKHLCHSPVITIGLVIVLTCLLSAGAIEIYLQCFLPPENIMPCSFVINSSGAIGDTNDASISGTGSKQSAGNQGAGSQGVGSQGGLKPAPEPLPQPPQKPASAPPVKDKSPAVDEPSSVIEPSEEPISDGGSSGQAPPVLFAPSEDTDKPSKEVEDESPKESKESKEPKEDKSPKTGLIPNSTGLKLTKDASIQTDPVPEPEKDIEVSESSEEEPGTASSAGASVDYFAGFTRFSPLPPLGIVTKLTDHIKFDASSHIISDTSGIAAFAIPFTFLPQTKKDPIKTCFNIAKTVMQWALRNSIYAAFDFTEVLEAWLVDIEMAKKTLDFGKLHEFAVAWSEIVKTVRTHPLHSPSLKAFYDNSHPAGLQIVELMGERLKTTPGSTLPLLSTVNDPVTLSPKDLSDLIHLIADIELVVHGETHVQLIRRFDMCYLAEDGSGLLYPVKCFNFHIHYYNELVTLLKPHDRVKVLKLFYSLGHFA